MKKLKTPLFILFGVLVVAHFVVLRLHPETNIGYQLWKLGVAPKSDSYAQLFHKDYKYLQSLEGKPIEDLFKLFPDMNDGSSYPAGSYRRRTRDYIIDGILYRHFWFDDQPNSFGRCVRVKNGIIDRFIYVKG